MSKLNWEKVRRQDQMRRTPSMGSMERMSRNKRSRQKAKPLGFPSKYAGDCGNCGVRFTAGTTVRFNAQDVIVHGRGCPKKSKGVPLAG